MIGVGIDARSYSAAALLHRIETAAPRAAGQSPSAPWGHRLVDRSNQVSGRNRPRADNVNDKCNLCSPTMPRKLKTYTTSAGFFDLAVAAPSMKAALEAWGSRNNLFHQGFAKVSDDPEVVKAAMAKPGVVRRRPVGTGAPFAEHASLPRSFANVVQGTAPKRSPKATHSPAQIDDKTASEAAARYERAQAA